MNNIIKFFLVLTVIFSLEIPKALAVIERYIYLTPTRNQPINIAGPADRTPFATSIARSGSSNMNICASWLKIQRCPPGFEPATFC